MSHWRILLLATLALGLSGCLQATLLKAQQPQTAANRYTVELASDWNRITGLGSEVWTKDGLDLQRIVFYEPVTSGNPLYSAPAGKTLPVFKADMRANDVADLFAATMLAGGSSIAETSNLRPHRFAGKRGFRFNISAVDQAGSRYLGEAFGAVIEEKLHLVVYIGHEEYYFERSREEVEAMMREIVLRT